MERRQLPQQACMQNPASGAWTQRASHAVHHDTTKAAAISSSVNGASTPTRPSPKASTAPHNRPRSLIPVKTRAGGTPTSTPTSITKRPISSTDEYVRETAEAFKQFFGSEKTPSRKAEAEHQDLGAREDPMNRPLESSSSQRKAITQLAAFLQSPGTPVTDASPLLPARAQEVFAVSPREDVTSLPLEGDSGKSVSLGAIRLESPVEQDIQQGLVDTEVEHASIASALESDPTAHASRDHHLDSAKVLAAGGLSAGTSLTTSDAQAGPAPVQEISEEGDLDALVLDWGKARECIARGDTSNSPLPSNAGSPQSPEHTGVDTEGSRQAENIVDATEEAQATEPYDLSVSDVITPSESNLTITPASDTQQPVEIVLAASNGAQAGINDTVNEALRSDEDDEDDEECDDATEEATTGQEVAPENPTPTEIEVKLRANGATLDKDSTNDEPATEHNGEGAQECEEKTLAEARLQNMQSEDGPAEKQNGNAEYIQATHSGLEGPPQPGDEQADKRNVKQDVGIDNIKLLLDTQEAKDLPALQPEPARSAEIVDVQSVVTKTLHEMANDTKLNSVDENAVKQSLSDRDKTTTKPASPLAPKHSSTCTPDRTPSQWGSDLVPYFHRARLQHAALKLEELAGAPSANLSQSLKDPSLALLDLQYLLRAAYLSLQQSVKSCAILKKCLNEDLAEEEEAALRLNGKVHLVPDDVFAVDAASARKDIVHLLQQKRAAEKDVSAMRMELMYVKQQEKDRRDMMVAGMCAVLGLLALLSLLLVSS